MIGSAYLVKCNGHEDALRKYETEKYEVARCEMHLKDGTVLTVCAL